MYRKRRTMHLLVNNDRAHQVNSKSYMLHNAPLVGHLLDRHESRQLVTVGVSHPTGVNSTFSKLECDRSVIEDMLGSTTGISENNIMSYLGQIEQRTNELLTVQAYLNSKVTCQPFSLFPSYLFMI